MTRVGGDLRDITAAAARVVSAWIRPGEVRTQADYTLVDARVPVEVVRGRVSFECAPGPAVFGLQLEGTAIVQTIPIEVPDQLEATLRECANLFGWTGWGGQRATGRPGPAGPPGPPGPIGPPGPASAYPAVWQGQGEPPELLPGAKHGDTWIDTATGNIYELQ